MDVAACQEKRDKREAEDRRPILKNLCATLLRSFKGQHGEKMVCARGNWNPRELGTQTGSETAPPRRGGY